MSEQQTQRGKFKGIDLQDKTIDEYYERKYWEEVEENLKLREEIEQLKWKIHCLGKKLETKKSL